MAYRTGQTGPDANTQRYSHTYAFNNPDPEHNAHSINDSDSKCDAYTISYTAPDFNAERYTDSIGYT
jgi:hypothetical protein